MERVEQDQLGAIRLLRNPAVRRLVPILAAAWAASAIFVWIYTLHSSERLRQEWLEEQSAIMGSLWAANPDLAEQWAGRLAHPERLSEADAERGRKLAERHGLTTQLEANLDPAISAYSQRSVIVLGAGFAVLIGLLGTAVFIQYRHQSADIRRLAVALENAVKHNRPMAFRLYEEGELGVLANSVQELALRLQQTIGQLHQEKDFLKDTVADISHQLKTPLASLIIYVDLLREGNIDDAAASEFLETCRRELDRMEWLIQTLLKIARLEADALPLQLKSAPVRDTVERAVKAVSRVAEERGVKVVLVPPDVSADAPVPHDARWLGEALANLLKNAVEHSPIAGQVTIGWEMTPVFLRMYVQDQGPGIDEAHLPHIFKKFYRASSAGSGVGLGLPLAKSIIERHGGMLSASGTDDGSRFVLTLPLHPLPLP